MNSKAPRVVVVTRATEYERLLERHGTRAQAEFFLKTRNQRLADLDARHARQQEALSSALSAIPHSWRRSRIDRANLSRFVFEPEDLLLLVGQDGLVANVAKYLAGQLVIGINPDPTNYDGVLARHSAKRAATLMARVFERAARVEARTMVEVKLDDGQRLLALNELFLGHQSHQSARYRIRRGEREERHSSSGAIVVTGTGATGWGRSIQRERRDPPPLPAACDASLCFFVREAFPSIATQTTLTQGMVDGEARLELVSEMNEGGVIFGDGIEEDRIEFSFGMRASVGVAPEQLKLVVA